jgi:Tfp pilus assembly protein PilZ
VAYPVRTRTVPNAYPTRYAPGTCSAGYMKYLSNIVLYTLDTLKHHIGKDLSLTVVIKGKSKRELLGDATTVKWNGPELRHRQRGRGAEAGSDQASLAKRAFTALSGHSHAGSTGTDTDTEGLRHRIASHLWYLTVSLCFAFPTTNT